LEGRGKCRRKWTGGSRGGRCKGGGYVAQKSSKKSKRKKGGLLDLGNYVERGGAGGRKGEPKHTEMRDQKKKNEQEACKIMELLQEITWLRGPRKSRKGGVIEERMVRHEAKRKKQKSIDTLTRRK